MGNGIQTALSIAGIILFAVSQHSPAGAEEGAEEMYKSAYESLLQAEIAQKGEEKELAAARWSVALEKLRELRKAHPDSFFSTLAESKIQECEAAVKQLGAEEAPASAEAPPLKEGEQPGEVVRPPTELQQHLAKGNDLAREKKYNEAMDEYKKALGVDPNNPVAYLNIATCYERLGNEDDAIRMLKKALQAEPRTARAHFKLGEIYLEKDMIDMAVSEYTQLLELKPDDPVAHWEIAGMYWKIKKFDESVRHFDRAAELFGETTPQGLEAIRNSEKIKLYKQVEKTYSY